jgi:hypothetical protein
MTDKLIPNDNTFLAPSNNPTAAYAASLVVKPAAGLLFGFTVYNSLASAQFIQLHDAAALPAEAAVPVETLTVPASGNLVVDYGAHGKAFGIGIVICNSSTGPTKTIGAANCFIAPRFK